MIITLIIFTVIAIIIKVSKDKIPVKVGKK